MSDLRTLREHPFAALPDIRKRWEQDERYDEETGEPYEWNGGILAGFGGEALYDVPVLVAIIDVQAELISVWRDNAEMASPPRYKAVIKVDISDAPERRARDIAEGIGYACALLHDEYGWTAGAIQDVLERTIDDVQDDEAQRE